MQTKTIFIITIIFSILYSYSFADESTIPDRPTNSAEYYTKQGDSFRERKMNYEAKDAYEKAIKLDANAGSAHFGLGRIHARLNKFDNAITELELAIKIDPENNIEAFRLLIFLLLYKDDIRCVRYLELLKKIKPELAEEISVFAVGAREYGIDIGEGGITVKGPLDDLPNTKSNDLIKEAFNFCQIGQYEKGSVLLKERLADKTITHEEKAVLNYALGLSFLYKPYINLDGKELFNNSQGLDYLKEAIKLCPNINEFRRGLIFAYIELEKYPEALEEIKVLLERKPDDKYALYSQGYIYFSTKEWGKAVESWGKLRNIDNILFALIQYEYEQAKQSMK